MTTQPAHQRCNYARDDNVPPSLELSDGESLEPRLLYPLHLQAHVTELLTVRCTAHATSLLCRQNCPTTVHDLAR